MSSINYFTGYKYIKSITVPVTITYTRSMFQPSVTGPATVKTDDTSVQFVVDQSNAIVESVSIINASCSYDPSEDPTIILTIYNITGPVTINITAHGVPLTLYVGGAAGGETASTYLGSWPAGGTIQYVNIYGITQTVSVSSFGLHASWKGSNKLTAYIYDVCAGTQVKCSNITLNFTSASNNAYIYFRNNTSSYPETMDYTKYMGSTSATASWTWNSVIATKSESGKTADIIIRSTR